MSLDSIELCPNCWVIYFRVERFACRRAGCAAPEGADCSVGATRVKGAVASLRDALAGTLDPLGPNRYGATVGAAQSVGASRSAGSVRSPSVVAGSRAGDATAVDVGEPNRVSCCSLCGLFMPHLALWLSWSRSRSGRCPRGRARSGTRACRPPVRANPAGPPSVGQSAAPPW